MDVPSATLAPEALHPSPWRASRLARADTKCIDTGLQALAAQLPGGGWPVSMLVDLLVQQAGVGEIRLLAPALARVAGRGIVLIASPHPLQALGLATLGLASSQLIWIRNERTADTLWASEQALRSGACDAVLLWQQHARARACVDYIWPRNRVKRYFS